MESIAGKDVFSSDVKDCFRGIAFLLPAGSGTLSIDAETVGTMVLKVKVGDEDPAEWQLNGRQTVTLPYAADRSTYVYVYASQAAMAKPSATPYAPGHGVNIYGIALGGDATGIGNPIKRVESGNSSNRGIYTLQGVKVADDANQLRELPSGLYIVNGRKVATR